MKTKWIQAVLSLLLTVPFFGLAAPGQTAAKEQPSAPSYIDQVDQQFLHARQKLDYLFQAAMKSGQKPLAKKIKQEETRLRIRNLAMHQWPASSTDWEKEPRDAKTMEAEREAYFRSKQSDFNQLKEAYQKLIAETEAQLGNHPLAIAHSMQQAQASLLYADGDPFEPNNNFSEAYPVAVGNSLDAYISQKGDVDFYKLTAPKDGAITVQLKVPRDVDYDLFIFNSREELIQSGSQGGVGVPEKVSFQARQGDTYYIVVLGFGQYDYSPYNPYTLTIGANQIFLNRPLDVDLPSGVGQVYSFIPVDSGVYTFFTGPYGGVGWENDTVLELYSDEELTRSIGGNDNANSNTRFSEFSVELTAFKSYYLRLLPGPEDTHLHTRLTVQMKPESFPVLTTDKPIDVIAAGESLLVYRFTPAQSGTHIIATSPYEGDGEDCDTILALYADPNLTKLIDFNVDAPGRDPFSEMRPYLVSGRDYYVVLGTFGERILMTRLSATRDIQPPSIRLGSDVIPEAQANDGSITAKQVVLLSNGIFAADLSAGVTVNNLPQGLGISVTRDSDTQLTISFTGRALRHRAADQVTNAAVTVAKAKILGASSELTSGPFTFAFQDPSAPVLTVGSALIPEAESNDGRITAKQTVFLSNGTFAADMSAGVTVNNLPEGLGIQVERSSDTQLTISFTGQAIRHGKADDVPNASITIARSKIAGAAADVTSGPFAFGFRDPLVSKVYTYQYDERNRIAAILANGAVEIEFVYSKNGQNENVTTVKKTPPPASASGTELQQRSGESGGTE
ncbi:hypothetical protein [Brevibacillus massiliensis]|uniref:hypothetical protein n=1 Tax=Brevibacillus massiliensis TaxID=1118054 RepID=UPI0002DD1774|nr:hypothetical protein [Brevibacillus massiliensis]